MSGAKSHYNLRNRNVQAKPSEAKQGTPRKSKKKSDEKILVKMREPKTKQDAEKARLLVQSQRTPERPNSPWNKPKSQQGTPRKLTSCQSTPQKLQSSVSTPSKQNSEGLQSSKPSDHVSPQKMTPQKFIIDESTPEKRQETHKTPEKQNIEEMVPETKIIEKPSPLKTSLGEMAPQDPETQDPLIEEQKIEEPASTKFKPFDWKFKSIEADLKMDKPISPSPKFKSESPRNQKTNFQTPTKTIQKTSSNSPVKKIISSPVEPNQKSDEEIALKHLIEVEKEFSNKMFEADSKRRYYMFLPNAFEDCNLTPSTVMALYGRFRVSVTMHYDKNGCRVGSGMMKVVPDDVDRIKSWVPGRAWRALKMVPLKRRDPRFANYQIRIILDFLPHKWTDEQMEAMLCKNFHASYFKMIYDEKGTKLNMALVRLPYSKALHLWKLLSPHNRNEPCKVFHVKVVVKMYEVEETIHG